MQDALQMDWLFWAIAFLLFLPLHLGTPLLYLLVGSGPDGVRAALPRILLWGVLVAAVAFGLAIWAWPSSKALALTIIVLAMLHPWIDLLWRRHRR